MASVASLAGTVAAVSCCVPLGTPSPALTGHVRDPRVIHFRDRSRRLPAVVRYRADLAAALR